MTYSFLFTDKHHQPLDGPWNLAFFKVESAYRERQHRRFYCLQWSAVNHLSAKSALNWPCSDVTFEIVVRNLCSLVLANGVETSARLVAKHGIRA